MMFLQKKNIQLFPYSAYWEVEGSFSSNDNKIFIPPISFQLLYNNSTSTYRALNFKGYLTGVQFAF